MEYYGVLYYRKPISMGDGDYDNPAGRGLIAKSHGNRTSKLRKKRSDERDERYKKSQLEDFTETLENSGLNAGIVYKLKI